nr:DUF4296 domain-containing protein [Rufibacter sediminis]
MCLLFLPFTFLACTPEGEKPADLISEEKMARIMIDVHLTEAAISRTVHHYDSSRVAYREAHKRILQRQGVSDSAFKHSYDYYLATPATMDKIYEVILDSLSAREAKLTAQTATSDSTVAPLTVARDTANTRRITRLKRMRSDSLKSRREEPKMIR